MRIGIYSRVLKTDDLEFLHQLLQLLNERNIQVLVYNDYYQQLNQILPLFNTVQTFGNNELLSNHIDYMLSIGGDGTLLNTLELVRDSGIPVLGINTGRLGLLTDITRDQLNEAFTALETQKYQLDRRTLISLQSDIPLFGNANVALNEFAIHKKDTSAMIVIHTYIDGEFVNSYWADGIIVATPSGSTAYSLSCGGPIIYPTTNAFVLTPVAPHNLNVRPVVIPDHCTISFEISGRSDNFLCSLDSRYETIDQHVKLNIQKANFTLNLVRLQETHFFSTIRKKLMWGQDSRN
ncbi:MAG: NAD kinase [Chitinophagales bacterium]|jgi:NAD+ kinase|nr:NAD kinase [Chitinophagales bacterium]